MESTYVNQNQIFNTDNKMLIGGNINGNINITINQTIIVDNKNVTEMKVQEDDSDIDYDFDIIYTNRDPKCDEIVKKTNNKNNQRKNEQLTKKDRKKYYKQSPPRLRRNPEPPVLEQNYNIYEQQIKAVKEIVEEFEQRQRWVILTAQMQSGKTTTYYLTATVMLMKRLVNKVIIFSGNNENELKIQINKEKEKLIKHLKSDPSCLDTFGNSMNIYELIDNIRENLIVLWGGHDMKKYEGHYLTDKVLYIWDESHAAQDKKNMPAKFLKDCEISGCGYQDNLEEQQSYMLSVSATPFSEISDNKHENQTKSIVNLEVNNNYHGLKKMIEKGLIKSYYYNDWKEHLAQTLNHYKRQEPKYALIRLRENRVVSGDELIRIISNAGWNYKTFDSSKDSDLRDTTGLKSQPRTHTVVILKGKCRMGKVVPKQFIAFCMETSKKSNTDVILQGLLGRMCGYHSYNNVEVHLSHHVFENCNGTNEFEKYIQYIQTNNVIPHKAKNILSGEMRKRSKFYPIIPIRIRFNQFPQNKNIHRSKIISMLQEMNMRSNDYTIKNDNNDEQSSELFERFRISNDEDIKIKYMNDDNTSYSNVPRIINESIETQRPLGLGTSCGIKANDSTTIVIWIFEKDYEEYGIRRNDIFIDARTETTINEIIMKNEESKKMPPTTKKEVFCRSDDDEITEYTENDTDCESGYDTDRTSLDRCDSDCD